MLPRIGFPSGHLPTRRVQARIKLVVPTPQWPIPQVGGHLFGSTRPEWQTPIVLEGPFPEAVRLRVRVLSAATR